MTEGAVVVVEGNPADLKLATLFVRRLKADPAACAIPLLVITVLDDEASRQRLAETGIAHVFAKPIDRWPLKAQLAELFPESGGKHA